MKQLFLLFVRLTQSKQKRADTMKPINSFIIIAIALVVIGCDKGFPDDDESILPTRTFRYSYLFTKYYSLNISFVSPDGMDLLAPFINTEDGCIARGQYSLIYILPDGSYEHQINVNDSELISYSGRYYMPATYTVTTILNNVVVAVA